MNVLRKVFVFAVLAISRAVNPRLKRRIKHLFLRDFEMLVLANEDVGRKLSLFGSFEEDESMFFRRIVREADICFDVGGNVGYFSLLLAAFCPKGHVHVFEPIKFNACLVETNAALNQLTNITVNQTAIGDVVGSVDFCVSADSAFSSMRNTHRMPSVTNVRVPITTIDSYVEQAKIKRVDIMKVDVEGAEELVVVGASKLLSDRLRRPRAVLMEIFDGNLGFFGSSLDRVIGRLAGFGYAPYVIERNGGRLLPYDRHAHRRYYNVIFSADMAELM